MALRKHWQTVARFRAAAFESLGSDITVDLEGDIERILYHPVAPSLVLDKSLLASEGDVQIFFKNKLQTLRGNFSRMRPGISRLLVDSGVKVTHARRMMDMNPTQARMLGRGMNGLTLEYAAATYKAHGIEIFTEAKFKSTHEYEPLTNIYSYFCHEGGHGIDELLGITTPVRRKKSKLGFLLKEVYRGELDALESDWLLSDGFYNETDISYYLPKSHGGTHTSTNDAFDEFFAETCAREHASAHAGSKLAAAFPGTTREVRNVFDCIDQLVAEQPPSGNWIEFFKANQSMQLTA